MKSIGDASLNRIARSVAGQAKETLWSEDPGFEQNIKRIWTEVLNLESNMKQYFPRIPEGRVDEMNKCHDLLYDLKANVMNLDSSLSLLLSPVGREVDDLT